MLGVICKAGNSDCQNTGIKKRIDNWIQGTQEESWALWHDGITP